MKRIIWSRFFRQFFHSRRAAGTRAARKTSTKGLIRPLLENLEDRTLPAPVFTVNAGGDAGIGAGNSGDIRYCIQQANISTNAGAIINFNTQAIGNQITLTHGELDISNTMSINGPGLSILSISGDASGNAPTTGVAASRVFNITAPSAVVSIAGLTITGGNGAPTISTTPGNQGGDIFNGGSLTLQNDVVQNGYVIGNLNIGSLSARGGGIFNAEGQNGAAGATLTLTNTLVEDNVAQGADGRNSFFFSTNGGDGGFGAGGGVFNDTNATVIIQSGSQILSNSAVGGKGGNGLNGLNGSNNSNGTGFSGGTGGSGGGGGAGLGGGLFNNTGGTLSIVGTNTTSILLTDNLAVGGLGGNGDFGGNGGNGGKLGRGGNAGAGGNGGNGGSTLGGGLYSSGTIQNLQFAQFAGNEAEGGLGGNASTGGHGGNGGSKGAGGAGGNGGHGGGGGNAGGGAIYSTRSAYTIQNTQFTTDSSGVGSEAIAGNSGTGSDGGNGGNGGGTYITITNGIVRTFPVLGGPAGSGGAGGAGGNALGGAVLNAGGTVNPTNNITFLNVTATATVAQAGNGNTAGVGANGGTGGAHLTGGAAGLGGVGGAGGAAQGGGVYNSGGSLSFINFSSTNSTVTAGTGGNGGNAGVGGVGGKGGGGHKTTGTNSAFGGVGAIGGVGGGGGVGGAGQGGGFYNSGGALTIYNSSFTSDNVSSGSGGNGASGGAGGVGGVAGKKFFLSGNGGNGAAGGAGGAAGYADGGGGTNAGGNSQIGVLPAPVSPTLVVGAGGTWTAQKAWVLITYVNSNGETTGSALTSIVVPANGTLTIDSPPPMGTGSGAATGWYAYVGTGPLQPTAAAMFRQQVAGSPTAIGTNLTLTANPTTTGANAPTSNTASAGTVTFTIDKVQVGNGGNGGTGGNGGEGGDANGGVLGASGSGGEGGNGGAGGSGSTGQGGGLSVTGGTLTIYNSTFGGSTSSADQVLGGNGGAGGNGGVINFSGAPGHDYSLFPPETPNGGTGGPGGAGTSVSGGGLAVSKSPPPVNLKVLNNFVGLGALSNLNGVGSFINPPDTQGAAGPSSYIETVNQAVAIYGKNSNGPNVNTIATDTLGDFFFNQGGLTPVTLTNPGDFEEQSDPFILYDPLISRYIMGDIDFELDDFGEPINNGGNQLLLAVSKTSNPTTLDKSATGWNFYQVNTAEAGVALQDYPGVPGYNADGLVVTFNSFDASGVVLHTQINTISMSALTSGTALVTSGAGQNVFQTDFASPNLRPTTMTDAASAPSGAPMWFVQSAGDGGLAVSQLGATNINVIEMSGPSGILTANPTFTTTQLNVNRYYQAAFPEQPDGSIITFQTDSRILNADESNGQIVAAQEVSDAAGDEDNVQWYQIDVSSGTPKLVQNGDVSGGPGVYDAYPGIAINSSGAIGMTYIQSGTSSGQFMSMYVTGRLPSDQLGTMEKPQIVQSGAGVANYEGSREGDMSGIGVDPTDGSFWAANEFADALNFNALNWGTAIAHFQIVATPPPPRSVSIQNSSFDANVLVAGNGNVGGKGGLLPNLIFPPQDIDFEVGGNNGIGGAGGDADGGGVLISNTTAQMASLLGVDISANSATGGLGGAGQFQDRKSAGFPNQKGGSNSSAGGNGGSVKGAGLDTVDYNVTIGSTSQSASRFKSNVGVAGAGGAGGSYSLASPDTNYGGDGGDGGSVEGGAIAFENDLLGALNTLAFSLTGATVTNNQMTAAAGGVGGGAGTWGHDHVLGGAGGAGGSALGGGIYVFASATAVNSATITSDTLENNSLTAGQGAYAGAGASATTGTAAGQFASGGDGGDSLGGGLYDNSLNSTSAGSLTIGYSTMAGNQLAAGSGGLGATGTTANGGPGGNGGNGGNAEGGGFFDGNSATLTVVNTTIGGIAAQSQSATTYSNVLTAGSGGGGSDAGTPPGLARANGGNGGNAGNTEGGGTYVNSANATFLNDTIVNNLAINPGLAGAPGSGAGSGGQAGKAGTAGVGQGGGYFAVGGNNQVNSVGNSIIDINDNVANLPASITGFDVEGNFTSLGNNILGSTVGATGGATFSTTLHDQIGVTLGMLNLGPLLNNGGLTPTDAVLNNAGGTSAAIDKGSNALISTYASLFGVTPGTISSATDQRGTGFPRIDTLDNIVDVGAYELDKPTVTTVTGTSNVEGATGVVLTITGSGFQPGAIVNFDGTPLTPTAANVTGGQIIVTDPFALPLDSTVNVTVGNPDGSGIAGEVLSSKPVTFTIVEAPFNLINPATGTTSSGGTITNGVNDNINLTVKPAAPDAVPDVGNFTAGTTLPPGLAINPNTGVISGTILPSAVNGATPQTYSVTITAYDGGVSGLKSTITFNWTINPFALSTVNPQTNNEDDTLSAANKNTIQVLTSTGSVTSGYTDVVAGKDTLPPGLTIDSTTGIISGTINPYAVTNGQASQTFAVTITAGPSGGGTASTTFNWVVNDTTPPAITKPSTQNNNIGDTLSTAKGTALQIQATDADSYTDVVNGQHTLPTGLSIDPNTGLITGTITGTTSFVYGVTITATDDGHSSSVNFQWNVTIPFGLINPGTESNDESDAVSVQMAPVSGYTASNYEASGLPTGLSINPNSGLITGTISPRGAGTYNVTVQANDAQGQTANTTFQWVVNDTTPPVLTNPGPQSSITGQTISHFAIQAVDADAGTWDATGLPTGLTIDPNTGVISGTIAASAVGNFTVTVLAADNGNVSAPMSFLWSVSAAPPSAPASPPSASPPSAPAIPAGSSGLTTNLSIVSVQNTYPGLVQMETVTVDVTSSNGFVVNEGVVTFQVDGQTVFAPVVNGVAKVTILTSLVDPNEIDEYLFAHPLTASYSDGTGLFASSGVGESVPAIYIDFILSLMASQLQGLNQTQTP